MKLRSSSGKVMDLRMGEGSGTVAGDSSRYGNDGALNGCKWVENGLEFNGSSDYAEVGDSPELDNMAEITISAWMCPVGWGEGNYGRVISKRKAAGSAYDLLLYDLSGIQARFYGDAATGTISLVDVISLNNWYHIVATNKNGEQKLYIDGVQAGSNNVNTGDILDIDTCVLIGKRYDGRQFNGSIDQVRIYNRALSAREIQKHYESTKHKYE